MNSIVIQHKLSFWIVSSLLILISSIFLFAGGLSPFVTRSVEALWNLGHVAYFSFVTYIFLQFSFTRSKSYLQIVLLVVAISLMLGFLIEFLQYGTARNTDVLDVLNDLLGSLLVLVFYRPSQNDNPKLRLWLRVCTAVFCVWSLLPITKALIDEAAARREFPVLSGFQSGLELERWHGGANYQIDDVYPKSLKITFDTQTYSGVGLEYFPSDWSQYKQLNLRIYNPKQEDLTIVLRVHDRQHRTNYAHADRFNKKLSIHYGWNELKIPLKAIEAAPKGRVMNLELIDDLSLFTVRLSKPENLYLDSVYLSL